MTRSANQIFRVFLISLFICAIPTLGQNAQKPTPSASTKDATWTRQFAVPFNTQQAPTVHGKLFTDPRFLPLLRASFPQRQWFWYDHGRLVSTDNLIDTFLGVSFGDPILDEGRYVTTDGCVPHVCDVDRGMLWIDTGVHPADTIFVATNLVGGNGSAGFHLWMFSSTKLNWQHLPPAFLVSLTRWLSTIAEPGYNGTSGYSFNFVLATIVQPSGVIEDITPETLHLRSIEPGAKQ
jgi:hypothetical protein